MKNVKGQTMVEMALMLPLLLMLAGGMMFLVYAGWQDLKVQQAANLMARVEGEEKINGGRSIAEITSQNGFGPGTDPVEVNDALKNSRFDVGNDTTVKTFGSSLFARMNNLIDGLFTRSERRRVILTSPRSSQNVDQVNVYRILDVPQIPFLSKAADLPERMVLRGTAYGGEDSHMYGLPRWGIASDSKGSPEWRLILKEAAKREHP